jgi:hypothetical protein
MLYEITRWASFSNHHSLINLRLYTQTLINLDLSNNQIGDNGTQHLVDTLLNNTVIVIVYLHLLHKKISYSRRHSSHWSSSTIRLNLLEQNILLMSYGIIRSISFYLHLPFFLIHLVWLIQTLTILEFYNNQIRDAGAQYLADALQNNTVTIVLSSFISYSSSSNRQSQQ